jgi:starch phosphorylase
LTIGFARRVAAYKRIYLLIADPDRAARVLGGRPPVQLVIAGKSHPQDAESKRILQDVLRFHGDPRLADHVAFVEDYDMRVASHLVRGCDLWLNLPRFPLEASGTSGMKAAMNGGLNLSVLDGWWAEAYEEGPGAPNGWAITPEPGLDPSEQDRRDASALYDLLENRVLPLWSATSEEGVPVGWIRSIKRSLFTIGPRFTATRMMQDYLATMYRPTPAPVPGG